MPDDDPAFQAYSGFDCSCAFVAQDEPAGQGIGGQNLMSKILIKNFELAKFKNRL
jgi:hypothetical protein